jgi:hypothetical protein
MIIIGRGKCFDGSQVLEIAGDWYYDYLFAHETGHIYENRYKQDTYDGYTFPDTQSEGTMPTYAGGCKVPDTKGTYPISIHEDYAETIGNWVQINTYDCAEIPGDGETATTGTGSTGSGGDDPCELPLWQEYPLHCEYADKVLMRDYNADDY